MLRQIVTAETEALGELQGHLRSVHLIAHLEMRALLTATLPSARSIITPDNERL